MQQVGRPEGRPFNFQATGFDSRKIKNVVEQGEQCLTRTENGASVVLTFGLAHFVLQEHLRHAEDAVHRGADLVTHRGQELALRDVRVFGSFLGLTQFLREALLLFEHFKMLIETDDHVGQFVVAPWQWQWLR